MKENSEGNRFKVGDRVRIARVDDFYLDSLNYKRFIEMIGTEAIIVAILGNGRYELNIPTYQSWRDSELEPAKEAQVLEILRTWRSSR